MAGVTVSRLNIM